MNYSLSSYRTVGKQIQRIITDLSGGANSNTGSVLTTLKSWHGVIDNLNPSGVTKSAITYSSFTALNSDEVSNNGSYADVSVTLFCTSSGNPKTIMIHVDNVTITNMVSSIQTEYTKQTGLTIPVTGTTVISCMIILHN